MLSYLKLFHLSFLRKRIVYEPIYSGFRLSEGGSLNGLVRSERFRRKVLSEGGKDGRIECVYKSEREIDKKETQRVPAQSKARKGKCIAIENLRSSNATA